MGQTLLLDRGEAVLVALADMGPQMRLPLDQAESPDQSEQARRLIPTGCRDEAFGLEGRRHEGAEDRLKGAGHGSMLPHHGALAGTGWGVSKLGYSEAR